MTTNTVDLNVNIVGTGRPLVLTHGVFGSGDNLYTAAKAIAERGYQVFLVDARNHGKSPHTVEMSYQLMAADLNAVIEKHNLYNPVVAGHSMGGKTVLEFSQRYSNYSKIVVIDIAPRYYPPHHQHIIKGLQELYGYNIRSRSEADKLFAQYVDNFAERQFILKNIYRDEAGEFKWRINIPSIASCISEIGAKIELSKIIEKPALFIQGELSDYINTSDVEIIRRSYTEAQIVKIKGANHWVHATKPAEFVATMLKFMEL